MSILAERLKQIRIEKGKVQSEISEMLGINKSTYSQYENGKRTPKPETLQKIADFYSVTVDYLLGSDMDKIDLIIQKVKELTDSNKLGWETYENYFAFSNPQDYQELYAILEHYNENIKEHIAFIASWKGMYYILIKKSEPVFIAARCDIISDFPELISGFKVSSTEKNLMPLLQSVSTVQNRASEDFYNSILDDLNNLDTNKPDKT